MSYSRFGPESDVYVFLNSSGYFECCSCALTGLAFRDFYAVNTKDIVAHVNEHVADGHKVPANLLPGLIEDKKENDKWIKKMAKATWWNKTTGGNDMRKVLHLTITKEPTVIEYDHDLTLAEMQELVGGDIELWPYRVMVDDKAVQMIVNEEGLIDGLPLNIYATRLGGDLVVGPAFVALDKDLE